MKYQGTGGVFVDSADRLYMIATGARRHFGMCSVYGLLEPKGMRLALFVPPPLEQRVAANDGRIGDVS